MTAFLGFEREKLTTVIMDLHTIQSPKMKSAKEMHIAQSQK
jgi:hypothetical protein